MKLKTRVLDPSKQVYREYQGCNGKNRFFQHFHKPCTLHREKRSEESGYIEDYRYRYKSRHVQHALAQYTTVRQTRSSIYVGKSIVYGTRTELMLSFIATKCSV